MFFNRKGSEKNADMQFGGAIQMESLESRVLMSTYYVSPLGEDGAAGAISTPWKTLDYALDTAQAEDVIILRGGTYAGGIRIETPNLTIQGYEGETAKIVAPINSRSIATAVSIGLDADGTTLRNLDISGGYYYALKTESNWDTGETPEHGVRYVLIEDSKIHGSGMDVIKITPGGDYFTLRNSEVYDSGLRDNENAEGIDNVNGDYMLVQDTYFHDIATNAIYAKGGSTGTVIERNKIDGAGHGGILLGQDTDYEWFDRAANPQLFESIDGVVRNNIIINTQGAGIAAYGSLRPKFYNNTLVNVAQSMQAGIVIAGMEHYLPPKYEDPFNRTTVDAVFANNLISVGDSSRPLVDIREDSIGGTLTMSNNRYFRNDGALFWDERASLYELDLQQWQDRINSDRTSTQGALGLDANYHLTAGSAAINAGMTLGSFADDYDGDGRPAGGWDIGADEFGGTATPPPASPPSPTPGPTPPPTPPGPVLPPPPPVPGPTPPAPAPTPPQSTDKVNGLLGEYFDNANLTYLRLTRTDANVDFRWGQRSPNGRIAPDTFSVRWTGFVMPEHSETYTFYVGGDDGARLWINGELILDDWDENSANNDRGRITLQEGMKYEIRLETREIEGNAGAQLKWSSASQPKEVISQRQLFLPTLA